MPKKDKKNFKVGNPKPSKVAAISKVSALKRTTEVVEHREGGDPSTIRESLGRTKPNEDGKGGGAGAIQHIKLENEGWEKDASLTEPTEN